MPREKYIMVTTEEKTRLKNAIAHEFGSSDGVALGAGAAYLAEKAVSSGDGDD